MPRNGNIFVRQVCALFAIVLSISATTRLQTALDLEAKGKLSDSRELLRSCVAEFRASGDQRNLAIALTAAGRVAVSLGDYPGAIQSARDAIRVRNQLRVDAGLSDDYNTIGLANLHLGNYDQALAEYERALTLDRARGDLDGQIERENNIGNVYYFRGRYSDALRFYQQALQTVEAAPPQPWVPWRRQLSVANLAALYQRLGKEQEALDLYRGLSSKGQAMPRTAYAQLLLNEGVLYRRLGDPIKALDQYRAAQPLFATEHNRDGEIGALRNIGIARAIDLDDLPGARAAFTSALELAAASNDNRGIVQASLYRGEVLRQLGRTSDAQADFQSALEHAKNAGLVEEQWKALYGLGKLAEEEGRTAEAFTAYRNAIGIIESVRAGIRATNLRTEFLADKRDVYDSVIRLSLKQSPPDVDAIFSWMERSRARTFEDRLGAAPAQVASIRDVQRRLRPDTLVLDFWISGGEMAALWIAPSDAGLVHHPLDPALVMRIARVEPEASRDAGGQLLGGLPLKRHLIIAPDGPLAAVPFEILTDPTSGKMLVEESDITYVPAARFITPMREARWRAPWRTQLTAFGDPPVSSADALASGEQWEAMPASAAEVRSIAGLLQGRSAIHLGADALKRYLRGPDVAGVPFLHFSTHAMVDAESPDRSRILLASDYLFQQEVYALNLKGADLVTVSACDTARGRIVRGDGIQAFSRAFLAAGAAATVTSLWRVADRPTAEFMKQFYYRLGRGQSKAEALRGAKLQFLHSNSGWSAPQYWAAFIVTGDGWDACTRVVSWSWILAAAAILILAAAGASAWRVRPRPKAAKSRLQTA